MMIPRPVSRDSCRSRSHRRLTVNERIDRILDGSCRDSFEILDENGLTSRETKRVSHLYNISFDDRFVQQRVTVLASPITKERRSASKSSSSSQRGVFVSVGHSACSCDGDLPNGKHSPMIPSISPIKQKQSQTLNLDIDPELQVDESNNSKFIGKPWYIGHSNVAEPPQCSAEAKLLRYGASGAIKMLAFETVAGTVPPLHNTKMHHSKSLDALGKTSKVDEWTPTLHGSPSIWPEDSAYAYGPKLEFHNTRAANVEKRIHSYTTGVSEYGDRIHRVDKKANEELKTLESTFQKGKFYFDPADISVFLTIK